MSETLADGAPVDRLRLVQVYLTPGIDDFLRQARATAIDVTDAASFLASNESSPEAQILARERTEQVQAALEHLSPNQRTIFLMRFAEDMNLAEIAEAINMPVNTVKTHLHRALKAVRAQAGAAR